MPDLAEIKTALGAWAVAALPGVDFRWSADPPGMDMKLPVRLEADGPHSFESWGQDFVSYEDATPDVVGTVVAHRHARVTFRAISRENPGNAQAEMTIERLRLALKKPSTREILRTAAIAVVEMRPSARFNAPFNGRIESVCAAELLIAFRLTDPAGIDDAVVTIESVEVTPTLDEVEQPVQEIPPA